MIETENILAKSKYLQIQDVISMQIRRGELKPGSQLPTNRDMMRSYSVSYATIAKAMDTLEQSGHVDRIQGKGTFVRKSRRHVSNIAVTFDDVYHPSHPYIIRILRGISAEVSASGWHHQLFPLPGASIFGGPEGSLLPELLRENRIGGVIACSPHPPEDIQRLRTMGIPVVSVGNRYPYTGAGCVMEDEVGAGRKAVKYLTDLGHRTIGLVMGVRNNHSARLIRGGSRFVDTIKREIRSCGLRLRPEWIVWAGYSWEHAEQPIRELLSLSERPTALIFRDDIIAIESIRIAQTLGIQIPQDLSVISYGDILNNSELTSIAVPLEDMGRKTVQMLLAMHAGDPLTPCSLLPVDIVEGQTCRHPAHLETECYVKKEMAVAR